MLVNQQREILLQLLPPDNRWPGYFGLPSGHVEEGESPLTTAAREGQEEIGVVIASADLRLVHSVFQARSPNGQDYLSLFLFTNRWHGRPAILEPKKCAGLEWFPLATLPARVMPHVETGLRGYLAGNTYSELIIRP